MTPPRPGLGKTCLMVALFLTAMSRPCAADSSGSHLIVEVLDAEVTLADEKDRDTGSSIRVNVIGTGSGKAPSTCVEGKFGTRYMTNRPAWFETKVICREYPKKDASDLELRVTLQKHGRSSRTDVDHVDVPLSKVEMGKAMTLKVKKDSQVVRIRVRDSFPKKLKKRVYFVRNGETKYLTPEQRETVVQQNPSGDHVTVPYPSPPPTRSPDLGYRINDPMYKYYWAIFPVNVRGRNQALALADKVATVRADAAKGTADERAFVNTERVLSSPLASAVTTAVTGLSPMLQKGPQLRLKRDARERRDGYKDSGTDAPLDEIKDYMSQYLFTEKSSAAESPEGQKVIKSIWAAMSHVDASEVQGRWWSLKDESWKDLKSRLYRFFVEQMLWEDDDDIILVGHAKFFRAFLQAQMQSKLKERIDECKKDSKGDRCKQYKGYSTKEFMDIDLDYCAVLAVDVDYSSVVERLEDPKSHVDVDIVKDIALLFGSGLWHD